MRGRYAATAERRWGRLCGYYCSGLNCVRSSRDLVSENVDGTIKKHGSQRVGPPTPVVLPPLAKHVLHEQHSQSDKHTLINLTKESNRHSHTVILQRPPMVLHRGVIALSAICAQVSRTAPLASQSSLPIGTGITLPFYMGVA
jgi:hypothetical protein